MSSATVSANVGIDCLGSLFVLRCSMPPGPYQFCSLIFPSSVRSDAIPPPKSVGTHHAHSSSYPTLRARMNGSQQEGTRANILGSWNIMTTSSRETCTSVAPPQ